MKTKHTPGPWFAYPTRMHEGSLEGLVMHHNEVGVPDKEYACGHKTVCRINFPNLDPNPEEQVNANARLIAASPDMFDFIKELHAAFTTGDDSKVSAMIVYRGAALIHIVEQSSGVLGDSRQKFDVNNKGHD